MLFMEVSNPHFLSLFGDNLICVKNKFSFNDEFSIIVSCFIYVIFSENDVCNYLTFDTGYLF